MRGVRVTLADGREYRLSYRAAKIVEMVCTGADRINAIRVGWLAFKFSDSKVWRELAESAPPERTEEHLG